MPLYNIWSEGYLATGMEGIPAKAQLLASNVEGDNFVDAVYKWYQSEPDALREYGNLYIDKGIASIWGCRLYDNEEDARKSFG